MGVLVTDSVCFPSPGKEEILKLTLLSIRQHAARVLFQPQISFRHAAESKGDYREYTIPEIKLPLPQL